MSNSPQGLFLLPFLFLGLLTVFAALAWFQLRRVTRRLSQEFAASRSRDEAADQRRHDLNELTRQLFEATPECIKLQSRGGVVERINPAGLALLETTEQARIVGRPVYSVIVPAYHQAYRQLTQRVFAGASEVMEFEILTFRGRRRWLETHAVPLRNDVGEVTKLLAITRDIHDRKRITRQLEEQRTRLQTIIESEPECVKLQSANGVITEMNPAGLSLLHATAPEDVLGRPIYEFMRSEYHEDYRRLCDAVFRGQRQSMEFEVTTMNGKRRWLETHAAPLRNGQGEVTALLAVTRDIEERKQTEDKLRRQRNELAHVCRLSTLGELSSGLAHELKQPLCAVSSYAETAHDLIHQNGTSAEDLSELMSKIGRETARADAIIERLREFVRKRSPAPEELPLDGIVNEALEFLENELKRHGIQVDVSQPSSMPAVRIDRVQTQQVLLNLLGNALQASRRSRARAGRIEVNIQTDSRWARIRVRDFADGVPPEHRSRLFSPFFSTRSDGLGLGLSISRSIAEAQGGQLHYEPAEPGSVFHLSLPVAHRGTGTESHEQS